MKRELKTPIAEIANYWIKNTRIPETELNFDWAEAHTHCWNCGDDKYSRSTKKTTLHRCHIVPHSLGGEDKPSNYVLMCKECHEEAPNVKDNSVMWDWIKSNYIPGLLTNTYKLRKALKIFEDKEGYSFLELADSVQDLDQVLKKELDNTSVHFGRKRNVSTIYYSLRRIANTYR